MKVTKSIQIREQIHTKLKQYCNSNGLKLQRFVEKLIEYELSRKPQQKATGDSRK